MAKKSAGQDSFTIHEGLSGIRETPTMYLGAIGSPMVLRCIKEVVDNAYDEAIAGRNKLIEVTVDYDNDWIVVADGAGGIPTEFKKLKDGSKISIMTAAFSKVHAGGKFNDKAYKTSSGTHGVGVSAVNAVSETLIVYSNYRGKTVVQEYSKGDPKSKNPEASKFDRVTASYLRKSPKNYGTVVRFRIDQSVVSESARRGKPLPKKYVKAIVDRQLLGEMLRNVAYLNPGLEVRYRYIRKGQSKEYTFINKKGLAWIPKIMCSTREFTPMGKPLVFRSDNITCAVIWADHADSDHFLTFVNTSPTVDGGWHVTGFMTALAQAIKPFIKGGKKKGNQFNSSDLLVGLTGMFEWRMHGAQYTSQIKDKLASRVDREVHEQMLPQFEAYFKKNKSVARSLIKRAQVMNKSRSELAAVVKSLASVKKSSNGNVLPSSLAASPKCKPEERELFLVEGDSAAGTAKNARDPYYQEVLGARGKPLNALRAPLAKLLANKEMQSLMRALGADLKTLNPRSDKPQIDVSSLRVRNLILLVDPDPDGGHIAVLFLAAIYRLLPDLLRQNRVWAVQSPPLYATLHKGVVYGGATMDECLKAAPKGTTSRQVVRIKGWGEVDETWLGPIAFDPAHRRLVSINPFENPEQEKYFRGVVAEDAQLRRQLLGLE